MNRSLSRIFIGLVTVLAVAVIGAALSWACSPGGEISGSTTGGNSGAALSGPSGSDVQVTGRGFTPGRAVEIHWNEVASPILDQTTVAQDGTFEASITIPQAPADTHTIYAASTLANGSAFARGMPFTVTGSGGATNNGPAANEAPASQGAAPQAPAQSTPGATGGQTSGGSQTGGPNSQSVNAPTAAPNEGNTGETLPQGGSPAESPLDRSRGTEDRRGTVPGPEGTPVFAGSAAPAGSVSDAGSSAPSTAASPAQSGGSDQSASGDLWSGFSSASAPPPSLNGAAGPADNSSRPMTVGLGLLGFGLVALVAGFGIADFRRRRRVATHARSR